MVTPKPTNACSGPPNPSDESAAGPALQLPAAPDFVSLSRALPLERALSLNEEMQAWYPDRRPTPEERAARKVEVEFVL